MANVVERVSLIVRSSIDELISKFEDPAKLIDQAIVDEKVKYAKLLDSAAVTFGSETNARKAYEDEVVKAKREHEFAAKALQQGNEGDARELLKREQEIKKNAETLKITYEAIKKSADIIRKSLDESKANIREMEAKVKEIKAMATATKAINEATSLAQTKKDINVESSFARIKEKAEKDYNAAVGKAQYINESNPDEDLENKYLEDDTEEVDALLAELRTELS